MAFPPLLAGLENACGATFCGDSKLLKAFRSFPVSTIEFATRDGPFPWKLTSTLWALVEVAIQNK